MEITMSDALMSHTQMDALIDSHYRAEEAGDLDAIVQGFSPDAEHVFSGDPDGPRHGGAQIADFYRQLLAELRIDRFETLRRWYGDRHAVERPSPAKGTL